LDLVIFDLEREREREREGGREGSKIIQNNKII